MGDDLTVKVSNMTSTQYQNENENQNNFSTIQTSSLRSTFAQTKQLSSSSSSLFQSDYVHIETNHVLGELRKEWEAEEVQQPPKRQQSSSSLPLILPPSKDNDNSNNSNL